MANMKIQEIEGIGPTFGEKLAGIGITDTNTLLAKGRTPAGRKEIAEITGLSDKHILKWVNMADLFRITGVGPEFAELLEVAGVDTVVELGQRNADHLTAKMVEVNDAKKLTRRVPSSNDVSNWVNQAKSMERGIEY